MALRESIINQLAALRPHATGWEESIHQLQAVGSVSDDSLALLIACHKSFMQCGLGLPNLILGDTPYDLESLQECLFLDSRGRPIEWKLTLSKDRLVQTENSVASNQNTWFFLDRAAYLKWAEQLSPTQVLTCNFSVPSTIFIKGLQHAFGGPMLQVLPIGKPAAMQTGNKELPDENRVRELLHVISGDAVLLNPKAIAITWGRREQEEAAPFRRLAAAVAAMCLAQDIYLKDGVIRAVIRGTRRVDLDLVSNWDFDVPVEVLDEFLGAVAWVFQERIETRHKLLSDRLSLDISDNDTLVNGAAACLKYSLQQAKERYGFVILDRKDAYLKELRDVMKDVRTQADLYAGKVRELVNTLLRDVLAVLFLIGVSLVGRVNTAGIATLVQTREVQLFFKVLAVYFVISIVLQLVNHLRDISLATSEIKQWQKLTHEYISEAVVTQNFTQPLSRRKSMFQIFAAVSSAIYICLAVISWKIDAFVSLHVANVSNYNATPHAIAPKQAPPSANATNSALTPAAPAPNSGGLVPVASATGQ
jgi:hypothetical protein